MSVIPEPVRVALVVAEALEAGGVRYLVGGSMASSHSGQPRSTVDIDMVVELEESDVGPLVAALGGEFHADPRQIVRAIRDRSSANVIHRATSIKVDLFVSGGTPLDAKQMERRQRIRVARDPERFLYLCTPEDILLQKLRWYRLGQEVSDRQWGDIHGILLVQGRRLDDAYLRDGARILGVSDLLERALREVTDR